MHAGPAGLLIRAPRPEERVGLAAVARRGELVDPRGLPAAVVVEDGVVRGLVTWAVCGAECELTPGIPLHGAEGLPLRDELELAMDL